MIPMYYFEATSDKQLGICLRMLLAEDIKNASVKAEVTGKHKIIYRVGVQIKKQKYLELSQRYEVLTTY